VTWHEYQELEMTEQLQWRTVILQWYQQLLNIRTGMRALGQTKNSDVRTGDVSACRRRSAEFSGSTDFVQNP